MLCLLPFTIQNKQLKWRWVLSCIWISPSSCVQHKQKTRLNLCRHDKQQRSQFTGNVGRGTIEDITKFFHPPPTFLQNRVLRYLLCTKNHNKRGAVNSEWSDHKTTRLPKVDDSSPITSKVNHFLNNTNKKSYFNIADLWKFYF